MSDQAVVELSLRLPRAVASEVESLQQRRPELLARMLQYGLVHQIVLERLERRWSDGEGPAEGGAAE